MMKRVQMLARCQISFFQDILALEPGERWERKLYEYIDQCDVFMLFWSPGLQGVGVGAEGS